MSQPPLFNQNNCSVPYVPTANFRFVSECSILPAPPPIFDCPEIPIPFDPPPQKIPCPVIEVAATGSAGYGGTPCTPGRFDVETTVTQIDSCGSCHINLDFDFDIALPPPTIPCPTISGGGEVTIGRKSNCSEAGPGVAVTVTKQPNLNSGSCDAATPCEYQFDFDFNIPIPCPILKAAGEVTVGRQSNCSVAGPGVEITITKVSNSSCRSDSSIQPCEFLFDFDFNIPVPCPVITAGGGVTIGRDRSCSIEGPGVEITVTKVSNSSCNSNSSIQPCQYEFDFDFNIPIPCPIIRGSASIGVTHPAADCGGAPAVTLLVTKVPPSVQSSCSAVMPCVYEFDFDFNIPVPQPPCPEFTLGGSVTVAAATCDAAPGVTITATNTTPPPNCSDSDTDAPTCTFDFDFDFNIPVPVPPCPTLEAQAGLTVTNGGAPDVTVTVTNTTASVGSCEEATECTFDFDFDFIIPLPCPVIDAEGEVTVITGSTACDAQPSVAIQVTKNTATLSNSSACEFTFDFDFVIPVPPPPCPRFTADAVTNITQVTEDGENCNGAPSASVGVVITTANVGDSCNPSCAVDFDFDFNFVIPPPLVPCPYVEGSASATVGYLYLTSSYASSESSAYIQCGGLPSVNAGVVITPTQGGPSCRPSCLLDFDFDFDFMFPQVPIPCPTFQTDATTTVLTTTGTPDAEVTIVAVQNNLGTPCEPICAVDMDFTFDFTFPAGGTPSAIIQIISVNCSESEVYADAQVLGRNCGSGVLPDEDINNTIRVYDFVGCNLNEPEGDLIGRKGWAKYMAVDTITSSSASWKDLGSGSSEFWPGGGDNGCKWIIENLCCEEGACGW